MAVAGPTDPGQAVHVGMATDCAPLAERVSAGASPAQVVKSDPPERSESKLNAHS
jgi:hypothetical protein